MKVLWLCPFPISYIKNIPVKHRRGNIHPATWLVNLAEAIVKYKPEIELHILSESTHIKKDFDTIVNGIHFHYLRSGSTIPFTLRGYPLWFSIDGITHFRKSIKKIKNKIKKINPDLIHAHGTEYIYSYCAYKLEYPYIITLQGIIAEIPHKKSLKRNVIITYESEVIRNSKYFIAKSKFARKYIETHNNKAVIFDVENIMHPAFFNVKRKNANKNNIYFIGSLLKQKGIVELLKAINEIPEINLSIIGSDGQNIPSFISKIIYELNLKNRLFWLGKKTSEEIAKEFEKATMLVLPSYMETSPNVVSEAMCAGVPVIASNVGGIPYMIKDGETGILVPVGNVNKLKNAIVLLLNNKKLIQEISQSAKKEAFIRFSGKINTEKIVEAYKHVVNFCE